MSGTSRVGLLLLVVLAVWVVLYYRLFVPLANPAPLEDEGVFIRETDSIGHSPEGLGLDTSGIDGQTETAAASAKPGSVIEMGKPDDGRSALRDKNQRPEGNRIPPPPPTTDYSVQKDETMESIARAWFGAASKWVLIAHENPFVDPAHLTVGQNLRLPPRAARLEDIPPEELARLTKITRYIAAPNDSLWKIAAKFYGKGTLYPLIAQANKELLGGGTDLREGMELVIPPYQRPAD